MSLRTRLLLALAYVVLLAIVALGLPLALNLRDRADSEVNSQARSQADVVAATASGLLDRSSRARLAGLATTAAESVRGRVLIVNRRGVALADSSKPGEVGASYSGRPEIASALRGKADQRERHSDTLDTDLLATAVPVLRSGGVEGAVRVTQSVEAVDDAVRKSLGGLIVIAGVVLALGLLAAVALARQIAQPMQRLTDAARRIARGDLNARAPVEGSAEQQSLARSFNEMTERLGAALDTERRFVADASHQLRTPLTGLRLRLEEAGQARTLDEAEPDLTAGMREVERLAKIVEELLVLSRADDGADGGGALDPVELADAAVERWQTTASEHGLALARGRDAGAERGFGSHPEAERILDALIENAIAYSGDSGRIEIAVNGGAIEVADSGPGLAPGEEEAVFERFHRGYASRFGGVPGSGLGLAIARQLAQRFGGDVTLENRPQGGARAVLRLGRAGSREEVPA